MALRIQIHDDMKVAMKAGEKKRLGTIRLILAAIKQREVDERIELSDVQVLAVMDKMLKQRRDSIQQFTDANRLELAEIEQAEVEIIQGYMPEALSEDEITTLINEAITTTGASSMKEMGKVMGIIKPKIQGRADMGAVSAIIKSKLGA